MATGTVVDGRYVIGTRIASGGMSTVYTAVDQRLGRDVAIKVMAPALAVQPEFRTRFEREARAVAQLNHPTLVNVFDQGVDSTGQGQIAFLVMELVRGGSLRELLNQRGPMPVHTALAVMDSVLHALSIAHARDMVHRDIKPDNILISSDHQVKLADFGLVRAASRPRTKDHTIIGTVAYLSPEQVKGERLDARSDLYSAGVVLYELLTGEVPFHGNTAWEAATARLSGMFAYPSEIIEGIPGFIDDAFDRLFAIDPGDRFQNASDLRRYLSDGARVAGIEPALVPVPEDTSVQKALAGLANAPRRAWDDAAMSTRVVSPAPAPGPAPAPQTAMVPPVAPQHVPPAMPPSAPPQPVQPVQPGQAAQSATAGNARLRPLSNRSVFGSVLWILVVVAMVVAVAVGSWWLTSGRYGDIPEILGQDRAQAQVTLQEAGFSTVIEERYSNSVVRGNVIGSAPPFGERAPHGSPVAVLVSLGRPTVPELGDADDPQSYGAKLAERTLSLTVEREAYSARVPKGMISEIRPAAGTEMPVGGTVTVTLSKGKKPVAVPDVAGQSTERARKSLEAAGLQVADITSEFDAATAAGNVLRTQPAARTEVAADSGVTLVVSNAITVPDLRKTSLAAAQRTLAELGVAVSLGPEVSDASVDAGYVAAQEPAAGTRLDPEQSPTVTLRVSNSVRVPFLFGHSGQAAKSKVEALGLTIVIRGPANGTVLRQTPGFNARLAQGDAVTVYTL